MKKKQPKTNAVRILESHGVSYELRFYDVDERDLSGVTVAHKIGLPTPQVFKTLVCRGAGGSIFLACIPTDSELDLKELARAAKEKKVDFVPVREIQNLTGYIRGGVSPVGTKKPCHVYFDVSADNYDIISLSAGARGCQMLIDPRNLDRILEITRCSIARRGTGEPA